MTNLNDMREICLCVLRWLIRPILALNCLLQMEQQRSEQDSSVCDALALALRCARFCSASLILFASYSLAPLLMRPRHFARSCAICSHDPVGMLKSLREALRVSLYPSSGLPSCLGKQCNDRLCNCLEANNLLIPLTKTDGVYLCKDFCLRTWELDLMQSFIQPYGAAECRRNYVICFRFVFHQYGGKLKYIGNT